MIKRGRDRVYYVFYEFTYWDSYLIFVYDSKVSYLTFLNDLMIEFASNFLN
mgnify:CR=1 FL=1